MWTDPLVLSVLQSCGVVGHRQHGDDEVDQSKDAVEPQKVVPERHKKTQNNAAIVISTSCLPPSPSRRSTKTCEFIGEALDSLCANVGQRCSSKVFRAVSCQGGKKNAT